jgi:FixJ family two-component response regulator
MIPLGPEIEPAPPVVFVVDDDASVRDALEDLIGSIGLDTRTFADSQALLRHGPADGPCCLVLDIRMPGVSGLEFQQVLAASPMACPVIFITAHGDVQMCARAMKAGAVDFLAKPFRDQDLLDAIQRGLRLDTERRRRDAVIAHLRRLYAGLNAGEREVMKLVVVGRLNKQIAAELGLSEITVKVRRGQLMRKLDVQNLPDLVRFAERLGELGQ